MIAPLISRRRPDERLHGLDAHQPPSWQHLFGTTDQGSDVFSQVVVGTRRSLLLGVAAGALATGVAATLGVLAAYAGGIIDEVINFLINVFLVIPPIPLLVVISGFLKNRGMGTMILVLGLVLWAFEARILRSQALSLKNRDFVLAAKVAGESTWRIVFGELMPNMISRIAAAFVLVFYISLLTDAGLEFLGLGDITRPSWGVTHVLGPGRTRPCSRASGGLPLPRRRARAHRARRSCCCSPASTRSATRACAAERRAAVFSATSWPRSRADARSHGGKARVTRASPARRPSRPHAPRAEVLVEVRQLPSSTAATAPCARSTASTCRSAPARSSGSPASRAAARAPSRTP